MTNSTTFQWLSNPRRLLFIDAVGAMVTASITALVLAAERVPTGLPPNLLYVLAGVAALFAAISMSGVLFSPRPQHFLRLIAIANLSYCGATVIICAIHFGSLTIWGGIYFPIEVVIVVALATWEWKVAANTI
jgi:hypothetical protein